MSEQGVPGVGGRRRWWTTVSAVTVPAVVATLAVLHPGVPVSQVDLNDGAVWVTNQAEKRLGRYNPAVDELNAGLASTGADLDVLQDRDDVLLVEAGRVAVVDTASVSLGAQAPLPAGARASMAAGTVVVTEARGTVWVGAVDGLGSLTPGSGDGQIDVGAGGGAVATAAGEVVAATADGTLRRAVVDDDGRVEVTAAGELAEEPGGSLDEVTAVGDRLVARAGSRVLSATVAVDLGAYGSAEELRLQQPGPEAGAVLVGAPGVLLEVPLDGGEVRAHRTGASGRTSAPVRVGRCGQGAWAAAERNHVLLCDGRPAQVTDLEGMSTTEPPVFRVNRDVVVLNDTRRGRLWVPLEDARVREPSWKDVEPDEPQQDQDQESQLRESTQNLQAECTAESAAPSAVDDVYGVRAGRTTILSVIDNDAASDCGVLTISDHDDVPADFGTLVPVHGGRALQLWVEPGASGTVESTYTVTDGRGTSAPSTATVRITVRDPALNEAPVQVRTGTLTVEQGATATYDVLADFRDPDGDPLVLTDATVADGGTARVRHDGELTFQAAADALGRHEVTAVVSDGTEATTGQVLVDVRPVGSVPPVVDPIQVSTYVDVPVVVRPLRSVRSASREPVRLAGVTEVVGLEIDADLAAGRFTVSAPRAGTYYVPFVVSAAPQEATGVVRVDVLERPEEVEPPIAVLDRALLPPGGEVTIDPLANDVDPAGVCSWCSPSRSRRTAVCGSPSSSTSCCGSPRCGPSRGR